MVYETTDGGITWTKVIGDITCAMNRHENVVSAGFVSKNIGYVAYGYFGDEQPGMRTYITNDGGKSWKPWGQLLDSTIIQDGYANVIDMRFNNEELIITIAVCGGSINDIILYDYLSKDGGSTWNAQNN